MRCIIFTGGELLDPHWHRAQIRNSDLLLCADKGAEHALSLGLLPQLVIGDMDSLSGTVRQELIAAKVPFKTFPEEKDETDTELALIKAIDLQPEEIIIFAGTGNRLDHLLANVFLLVGYLPVGIPISLMTPVQTLWVTEKSTKITGYPGQLISFLALSQEVRGLTLKGFYYPLEQAVLQQGSSKGISNIMLGAEALVEFAEGILLVVQKHSAEV